MSRTIQQYISMHQLKSILNEANNLSVEMIEESNPLVVKRVGDEVVGICGVRRTELANTLYLYVKGQYRGRGYGKELVREVVRQARDCKIDGIVLLVRLITNQQYTSTKLTDLSDFIHSSSLVRGVGECFYP